METKSRLFGFLASLLRDAGAWMATHTNLRDAGAWRLAQEKRRVERELRAKGTPRTKAREIVAALFRQREPNKEHQK